MIRVKDIAEAVERAAPLNLQDDYDNSGLQVGFPSAEVRKVLVCLDVTEAVMQEAADKGCGLIVSHHPLLFRALRQVSDSTYQQRCAVSAIRSGIAIYSAHTSLDNAPGGVNHKIAALIGLDSLEWLSPKPGGADAGSGLVGNLPEAVEDRAFLAMLKAADTGQNFWYVFGLAVGLFILVQIITETIVIPKIMGKAMGLNPAILLLSLSVWGAMLGFIGLIIALPLTTLIIAYWQRYVTKEHEIDKIQEKSLK